MLLQYLRKEKVLVQVSNNVDRLIAILLAAFLVGHDTSLIGSIKHVPLFDLAN
jgi:hypothetical protein